MMPAFDDMAGNVCQALSNGSVRAALNYCSFSPKTKGVFPRVFNGGSKNVVMGIGTGEAFPA
jgi:hypothetical protein